MAAVCSVQLRRAAGEAERARVREQAEEAKARRARLRRERREEAERQAQMRQLRQRAWPFLRARMAVAHVKGQRDWEGLKRAHAARQQAQREAARGAPRQRTTAEAAGASHTREVSEIFITHSSPQGSPPNDNNENLAQDDSGQSSAQSAAEGAQTGRKRRLCTLDTQYEGHYDEVKRRCRQSSTATEAEAQGPHRFQRVDIARTGRRTMERLEDLARGDG